MYLKAPFGLLLTLTGITAPTVMTPAAHAARLMLQIVGIGFGCYCTAAAGLVIAGIMLRRRTPAPAFGRASGDRS